MKGLFFFIYACVLLIEGLKAQQSNVPIWIWEKGSSAVQSNGNYGLLGIESSNNEPPARTGGTSFSAPDQDPCFFGGSIVTIYGNDQKDDIWRYNFATGNWTWIKGSQGLNLPPSYGILGVESPVNTPGGRSGCGSWMDNEGNLWIFGGDAGPGWNNYHFNDLWKFNFSTNNWTCVMAFNDVPSPRSAPICWKDTNGNFWMYGGFAHSVYLDDLWKFSPITLTWTRLAGSIITSPYYIPPNHGTIGVPASTNTPGSRCGSGAWIYNNDLYFFGGQNNMYGTRYNDVWKYSIANNQWTWIHGSNQENKVSILGTQGQPAAVNIPGARSAFNSTTDNNGNVWIFGGYGYSSISPGPTYLNDLWKYKPSTNQWTWIRENDIDQSGIYGNPGLPDPANKPGCRSIMGFWSSGNGNIWLFGGRGYAGGGIGEMNDLWRLADLDVVPLNLFSFEARAQNNLILLNWKITGVQFGSRFVIERSYDQSLFTSIASMEGLSYRELYQFEDTSFNRSKTRVFYRLKMIGPGGNYTYSKTRVVTIKSLNVSLFPNPASDNINFNMPATASSITRCEIINTSGKLLIRKLLHRLAPGTKVQIQIGHLPRGIYYVKLLIGEETTIQRFSKI